MTGESKYKGEGSVWLLRSKRYGERLAMMESLGQEQSVVRLYQAYEGDPLWGERVTVPNSELEFDPARN